MVDDVDEPAPLQLSYPVPKQRRQPWDARDGEGHAGAAPAADINAVGLVAAGGDPFLHLGLAATTGVLIRTSQVTGADFLLRLLARGGRNARQPCLLSARWCEHER